jgi:hypothetical protein
MPRRVVELQSVHVGFGDSLALRGEACTQPRGTVKDKDHFRCLYRSGIAVIAVVVGRTK